MPTETVYGLAADAGNPDAVARIFAAKGRPTGHPLIVHGATPAMLADWIATPPPASRATATMLPNTPYWPEMEPVGPRYNQRWTPGMGFPSAPSTPTPFSSVTYPLSG